MRRSSNPTNRRSSGLLGSAKAKADFTPGSTELAGKTVRLNWSRLEAPKVESILERCPFLESAKKARYNKKKFLKMI